MLKLHALSTAHAHLMVHIELLRHNNLSHMWITVISRIASIPGVNSCKYKFICNGSNMETVYCYENLSTNIPSE